MQVQHRVPSPLRRGLSRGCCPEPVKPRLLKVTMQLQPAQCKCNHRLTNRAPCRARTFFEIVHEQSLRLVGQQRLHPHGRIEPAQGHRPARPARCRRSAKTPGGRFQPDRFSRIENDDGADSGGAPVEGPGHRIYFADRWSGPEPVGHPGRHAGRPCAGRGQYRLHDWRSAFRWRSSRSPSPFSISARKTFSRRPVVWRQGATSRETASRTV